MGKDHLAILVVEDDAAHATAIRRALLASEMSPSVTVVDSLEKFRSYLETQLPDIAVMDMNLPDGRAVEALAVPAESRPFPILLMTSYGNEQLAVEVIKAGALDYIVKSPEAFASMAGTVERALREWNLLQDKKRMEQQLLESQARVIQQEKMAYIGLLAAGVAHEINNPIGFVSSNLNSLAKYADKLVRFIDFQGQVLEKCANGPDKILIGEMKSQLKLDYVMPDMRELINETIDGTRRVTKIVQDLQNFARVDSSETTPCDLNQAINSTVNIVRNELRYVAELNMQLDDLPPVRCHPQQIGQVVMNLLLNAAHSIEGQGVIGLRTALVGNSVEISVTDDGCGIAPEYLDKIFEPFFTTKECGKGTGLGLAVTREIVIKHGGELLVSSEVGKGTTFTVRLPVKPTNAITQLFEES